MNNLVPVRESIFDKIKNFFKNLFNPNTVEDFNVEITEDQQQIKNLKFSESLKVEETEEQKLLKLQKLIRAKRISEQDLTMEERKKLRSLYESQIKDLKKSIVQKRNRIMKIKYEQERKAHAKA